jgi:hypothetical protein
MERTYEEEREWKGSAYEPELQLQEVVEEGAPEITEEEARERICGTAESPGFAVTPESQEALNDLILAAQVEAKLTAVYPCVSVNAENGIVTADVEAPLLWESRLVEEFKKATASVPGVKDIRVHILPETIYGLG